MKITKRQLIFALSIMAAVGLAFFGGHTLGYSSADENMRLRTSTAETTADNCLKKMSGWCDNKRFRLVDCGNDLQVCVCMSQRDVQGLKDAPEVGK
jgi:hypothetical protein